MTDGSSRSRRVQAGADWVVVLVCALAMLALLIPWSDRKDEVAAGLRVGMSTDQVVAAMGEPPDYSYTAAQAPENYYVDGWGHKERAISGEVHIFMKGEFIVYVWLSKSGEVEDWHVGES